MVCAVLVGQSLIFCLVFFVFFFSPFWSPLHCVHLQIMASDLLFRLLIFSSVDSLTFPEFRGGSITSNNIVTGTYYPSGAPKFRGNPLTSNNIMTGTSYPSGAPKFRADPLTSNNIVTGTSYPSGASELCGDPLTLAHSHICQLSIAENYFRWRWTFWINIGNVVHNVRGNLSRNITIKIGIFFQSSFCRDI